MQTWNSSIDFITHIHVTNPCKLVYPCEVAIHKLRIYNPTPKKEKEKKKKNQDLDAGAATLGEGTEFDDRPAFLSLDIAVGFAPDRSFCQYDL